MRCTSPFDESDTVETLKAQLEAALDEQRREVSVLQDRYDVAQADQKKESLKRRPPVK